jgi:hypothetical protein
MKLKIRPDDTSMLQMNDWLAELRDDGCAEPPAAGSAEPAGGNARPEAPLEPAAPLQPAALQPAAPFEPAAPLQVAAPVQPAAPVQAAASSAVTVRAVIGDQLRMPIMWCEMGSCISWHADPAALGEGDARARAIGAGWRIDAFGRLACPRCQQTEPGFRASRPVVRWDRYAAIATAARIAAGRGDWTAREQPVR